MPPERVQAQVMQRPRRIAAVAERLRTAVVLHLRPTVVAAVRRMAAAVAESTNRLLLNQPASGTRGGGAYQFRRFGACLQNLVPLL
jgi:hypothetical protein